MKATILIPTTGDRACLMEHALWSIGRQSVGEFEVFIIGDGVAGPSREWIVEACRRDPRIRFFDHPKHPRRGEEYRHAALQEARGEIVCYLCDRDLYLPGHVAALHDALRDADFAHSLPIVIREHDRIDPAFLADFASATARKKALHRSGSKWGVPLSTAAHRLEAYQRLPEGWSTTPATEYTDVAMWRKFISHPGMRLRSLMVPTVIYLPRGSHPGWPVPQRLAEMERWHARMEEPGFETAFLREVLDALARSRAGWAIHPFLSWARVFLETEREHASRHQGRNSLRVRGIRFLLRHLPGLK